MNYDVYHGTIDSKGDHASQLFYAKPRCVLVVCVCVYVCMRTYVRVCVRAWA